jgi:hypothetical protein
MQQQKGKEKKILIRQEKINEKNMKNIIIRYCIIKI